MTTPIIIAHGIVGVALLCLFAVLAFTKEGRQVAFAIITEVAMPVAFFVSIFAVAAGVGAVISYWTGAMP